MTYPGTSCVQFPPVISLNYHYSAVWPFETALLMHPVSTVHPLPDKLTYMNEALDEVSRLILKLPRVIQVLGAINVGFWILWWLVPRFMERNAGSSSLNLSANRPWALLLSAFSHISLVHLFFNMSALLQIGPKVCFALGDRLFISTVAVAAVFSGVLPILVERLAGRVKSLKHQAKPNSTRSTMHIGFSGVNAAIMYLFATLYPTQQFEMLTFGNMKSTTVSAIKLLKGLFLVDVLGLIFDSLVQSTGISHAGHIGGFLAGYLIRKLVCLSKCDRGFLKWSFRGSFCKGS